MAYQRIDPAKARELISARNARVVDVRDGMSFEAGHIADAELIDQTNVRQFIDTADHTRPLIVCCYHGNMSQGAADYFNQQGFEETYSLDGGYEAWQATSR